MKKFTMVSAAAAFTLVAGVASASPPAVGNDGIGIWTAQGSASDFCKLGQTTVGNLVNATVDTGVEPGTGYTGANSDGIVTFSLQNTTNDTLQHGRADVSFPGTICNTAWTVTAGTTSSGMKYTGTQSTTDPRFLTSVAYTVATKFGGQDSGPVEASTIGAGPTTMISGNPAFGDFRLTFNVPAQNNFLLSGNYSDVVTITLAPSLGPSA